MVVLFSPTATKVNIQEVFFHVHDSLEKCSTKIHINSSVLQRSVSVYTLTFLHNYTCQSFQLKLFNHQRYNVDLPMCVNDNKKMCFYKSGNKQVRTHLLILLSVNKTRATGKEETKQVWQKLHGDAENQYVQPLLVVSCGRTILCGLCRQEEAHKINTLLIFIFLF